MILGVDIGTSKLCAMAFDEHVMRTVAVVDTPNAATITADGRRHEQDPVCLRDACFALLQLLQTHPLVTDRAITTICVTGQMHGLVLVDAALQPVSALITWRDRRAEKSAYPERLDPAAPSRLGCVPALGYGGITLDWLAKQGTRLRGLTALSIADYLVACLTGMAVTEPTHAASWGLYDLTAHTWDAATLKSLDIPPEVLPRLVPSSMPVGELSSELRRRLPNAQQAVVLASLGDNQAGVIGATALEADTLVCNLGTGGQISVPLPEYRYQAGLETRPMPFGGYIAVGSSLCGGWAYAYLAQFFQSTLHSFLGRSVTLEETYVWMNSQAAKTQSDGLSVDTRFAGTRFAPTVTGAITGINTENLQPAPLIRATLEGIVRELEQMWRSLGDVVSRRVVTAGNASHRNPILTEIITTMFGLPCVASPVIEEAAFGAVLAALVGRGLATPEQIRSYPFAAAKDML